MSKSLIIGIALAAASAAAAPSVTGTFSSLAYHEDSGDLVGAEFRIVYSYEGYFITLQCGGGIPVTKPIQLGGAEFSFQLEEASGDDVALCGLGHFSGRVVDEGRWFRRPDFESQTFLPRSDSYWEKRSRVLRDVDE